MTMRLFRVGAVALIAMSVALQGCIVPWSKYIKLKKQYDQLVAEVERKDSQIADDQERITSLTEELKSKDQLIKLYEDKKKDAERLTAEARAAADALQAKINELAKGLGPGVTAIPGGVAITDQLLFALGSADISAEGQKLLAQIAEKFKGGNEVIQIDGHTDDARVAKPETVQRFGDNWGLASERALAVLRLLAKNGVAERRMYARSFSMFKPTVPNTSDANKAKNRRVEIYFMPPEALAAPPAEPKTN